MVKTAITLCHKHRVNLREKKNKTKVNRQTVLYVSHCLYHFLGDSEVFSIHLIKQVTLAEGTDGEHFEAALL